VVNRGGNLTDWLEAHQRHILSSLSTGVIVVDLSSRILYVNHAAEAMIEEESSFLVGSPLLRMPRLFSFVPVINDHRKNNPSLAVSGRQVEASLKQKDGSVLPLGCSITNLSDEMDVVRGYVILFRDLTELNRLKSVAKRSEHLAALGTMAAGVAHEIRNPLHAIRASVELTQLKLKKGKPVDAYLDIILKEVGRLNNIVGDILSFSRDGTLNLSMTPFKEYIEDSVPLFALSREIELLVDVDEGLPLVPLDKAKFLQVLLNVVRNAAEAMGDSGKLQIKASLVNSPQHVISDHVLGALFLCLSIIDSGPGMNDETLSHIFEPFFSSGKSSKGTGLGLPICQRIVEAHSGCIEVTSEPGKGTVFSIFLPVRTTFSLGLTIN
jgi:PAS domain S-box-containing protein